MTMFSTFMRKKSEIYDSSNDPILLVESESFTPSEEVSAQGDEDSVTEIGSLMSALKAQTLRLQCDHAKSIADLMSELTILTSRVATLEPVLHRSMTSASEKERLIPTLEASNAAHVQQVSDLDGELQLLRPRVNDAEEQLRTTRKALTDAHRKVAVLEGEYAKSQGTINDLFHKVSIAEGGRQRMFEENDALQRRIQERDSAVQTLLRDNAKLRADQVNVTSDLERQTAETGGLTAKLHAERDEHGRTRARLSTVQAQHAQLRTESAAQIADLEERERHALETLGARDKQLYDLEIKQSALHSRADFLTRMNEKLREDTRRHLDHVGMLEASNRQLLDAMARNVAASEEDAAVTATSAPRAPQLRSVSNE